MLRSNVPCASNATFEGGVVIIWDIYKGKRAEKEEDIVTEHR